MKSYDKKNSRLIHDYLKWHHSGGPEEVPSGGFNYGGWGAPYDDDVAVKVMEKLLKLADLLLGRKTFEIWANYWPAYESGWPGINEVTKWSSPVNNTAS